MLSVPIPAIHGECSLQSTTDHGEKARLRADVIEMQAGKYEDV
jgi:hypothetical protein